MHMELEESVFFRENHRLHKMCFEADKKTLTDFTELDVMSLDHKRSVL